MSAGLTGWTQQALRAGAAGLTTGLEVVHGR